MTATATLASRVGEPQYHHLFALADSRGVFEHAEGDRPRREHGYCVDDVSRALVVAVREPERTAQLDALEDTCLAFLGSAASDDGLSHNRLSDAGAWTDRPSMGDWWGRSLWALGTATARATRQQFRDSAAETFLRLARQRSRDVRAMAFAALGAGEFIAAGRRDPSAIALLGDAAGTIPTRPAPGWGWPEQRLRYANGALPEALILAGKALGDARLADDGIRLIDVLAGIETRAGHLSVTGPGGRGPADSGVLFDQQPIEVAAIADAAARAFDVTGQERWRDLVALAWRWFLGANDSSVPMVDTVTGAGYDGLERGGRNDNRGAESTIAALSTWQQASRLAVLGEGA